MQRRLARHFRLDGPALRAPSSPCSAPPPLALFVVYHLCNPRPKSRLVFCDQRFLTLAAMLGAGGTAAFIVTGVSLVAAVTVHWAVVSVWLFLLGGYQILGYHKERKAAD